jgi:hypothetical protein
LADKKSKNDYYEQQELIMRHNLMSEMSKMDSRKGLDQWEEGRKKKITTSVFSLGSEKISLNLTTTSTKLNTKINFNKKSCDTTLSFHNRLRLDFNRGESKHWKSWQVAKGRSGEKISIQWTNDDEVTECKVNKKISTENWGNYEPNWPSVRPSCHSSGSEGACWKIDLRLKDNNEKHRKSVTVTNCIGSARSASNCKEMSVTEPWPQKLAAANSGVYNKKQVGKLETTRHHAGTNGKGCDRSIQSKRQISRLTSNVEGAFEEIQAVPKDLKASDRRIFHRWKMKNWARHCGKKSGREI